MWKELWGLTRQALQDSGKAASEIDKVILVGGSTRIPSVQEAIRKETGQEPHRGVNPDEVVAMGASIRGRRLVRRCKRRCTSRCYAAITWN